MSDAFISTKFYIPRKRENFVSRPRLVEKMLSGLHRPGSIVLVSGPAGFGKTTLLGEFAARYAAPIAWLSLDEGENDPVRFWTYLVKAIQAVKDGVGDSAAALFNSPQPPPGEAVASILINDLAGSGAEFVLVLDDLHLIQNEEIHRCVSWLLDHQPENLHVVGSTRIDPPWPLARLRARSQLVEIRAADLRFTNEEAAAFLRQFLGFELPAKDVAALEARTEGWAAGLQLAALSMQGRDDIPGFIQSFTGSHLYIAEYLVEEVFKTQPEAVRSFLLETSILERLNAGLCEAVTGCADGQARLLALHRANLFTIPLDDRGEWFRYHQLFADLLKARLQRAMPKAETGGLHRRAAAWYEQAGMAAEAVEHALAAQDYALVMRLVEKLALPMMLQASVVTVEHWLQAVPPEFIEKSPGANMAYAWMNLLRGTVPQAVPYIERLKNLFSAPGGEDLSPTLQGEWLAIQAELLMAQGKAEESRELANHALKILPGVEPQVRGMVYVTLAKAYQQTFDYDHAAEVFQMIAGDARDKGDITFEILGTSGHAQMVLKQGRLHRTFEIVNEGIRRLELSGKKIPFSATLYGELGQVYYQWHRLDLSRQYLRRSMEISGKSGYSDPEIYYHLMLSRICQMEGDLDGFVREMQQASELASAVPPAMIREHVLAQQVRADLAADRPAAAEKLLAAEGFAFGETFRFPELAPGSNVTEERGLVYNSALRVLLQQARQPGGRENLERGAALGEAVFQGALQCQHLPTALETLLLLSQMHAELGDRRQSLAKTALALELAEPEGFISIFVEEGRPAADALAAILENGLPVKVRPEYIREILDAFPAQTPAPGAAARQAAAGSPVRSGAAAEAEPLVEPLTPRELEVLRLIAAGDSNQAVAEKLVITVSAVKKHTGNIYSKLNVNSRTQAAARARQLGLLPPGG